MGENTRPSIARKSEGKRQSALIAPSSGGSAAHRGHEEAIRCKTSPRPRSFRLAMPFVAGETGRQAASFVRGLLMGIVEMGYQ